MSESEIPEPDGPPYYSPLVTIEEWDEFVEESAAHFDSYVHATGAIIKELDGILATTNSFQELKKELTEFVAERRSFLNYVEKHFP